MNDALEGGFLSRRLSRNKHYLIQGMARGYHFILITKASNMDTGVAGWSGTIPAFIDEEVRQIRLALEEFVEDAGIPKYVLGKAPFPN